jgi:hypothetical protein
MFPPLKPQERTQVAHGCQRSVHTFDAVVARRESPSLLRISLSLCPVTHDRQTTTLVFARASNFWGARAEIRDFLLGRVMPDLLALTVGKLRLDSLRSNP